MRKTRTRQFRWRIRYTRRATGRTARRTLRLTVSAGDVPGSLCATMRGGLFGAHQVHDSTPARVQAHWQGYVDATRDRIESADADCEKTRSYDPPNVDL